MIIKFLKSLERFCLPEHCIACKASPLVFCPSCRSLINEHKNECPLCARKSKQGKLCKSCAKKNPDFPFQYIYIFSQSQFSKSLVFNIQTKRLKSLAIILGRLMGRRLMQYRFNEIKGAKVLAPYPLDLKEKRKFDFDYNLSLSLGISELTKWPILKQAEDNLEKINLFIPCLKMPSIEKMKKLKLSMENKKFYSISLLPFTKDFF